ncbi:hypothetical protein PMAYCL1PPCAC_17078, partial [Pristionchus mayeri]
SSLTYSALLVFLVVLGDACMRVNPGTPGMPAMNCRTCAANLVATTMVGAGSKAFGSIIPSNNAAGCLQMEYICNGLNSNIENSKMIPQINTQDGVVADGDDGAVDMVARFTVTCNAAGTAWENTGITITTLECASD